jgi:hypothetical protein
MVEKKKSKLKPKREPQEKVVLTKITAEMTDEELEKQINAALDEIFGVEDEQDRKNARKSVPKKAK